METKANNVVVGAFVVVSIFVAVLFLVWISRSASTGAHRPFYVVFSGSVQGLSVGSSVLFNGLRVGEVSELGINPGNRSEIRARVVVDELAPVKRNTRARLASLGFTGVASIEFFGGTDTAENLVAGSDGVPPAIFAERSFVQNLLEGGADTLSRVNNVIAKVEETVGQSQTPINNTLRNVEFFSEGLAKNSDAIGTLIADLSVAARRIADLSSQLQNVAEAINPARVREIVDGAAAVVTALADEREKIGALVSDASSAARNIAAAAEKLQPGIARATEILAAVDPQSVGRSIQSLERNLTNAEKVTKGLADGSDRIVSDVSDAAKSIRQTAENLDKRIQQLSGSLQRFSDSGLTDLQSFVNDGRRTIATVDRVFREVERNPQQFVFGRPGAPDFPNRR